MFVCVCVPHAKEEQGTEPARAKPRAKKDDTRRCSYFLNGSLAQLMFFATMDPQRLRLHPDTIGDVDAQQPFCETIILWDF